MNATDAHIQEWITMKNDLPRTNAEISDERRLRWEFPSYENEHKDELDAGTIT